MRLATLTVALVSAAVAGIILAGNPGPAPDPRPTVTITPTATITPTVTVTPVVWVTVTPTAQATR